MREDNQYLSSWRMTVTWSSISSIACAHLVIECSATILLFSFEPALLAYWIKNIRIIFYLANKDNAGNLGFKQQNYGIGGTVSSKQNKRKNCGYSIIPLYTSFKEI